MALATIYTTRSCPYCMRAKQLLLAEGITFKEISIDNDPVQRQEMMQKSGRHTVPQIWLGQTHIGGCDDLYALANTGRLPHLQQQAPNNK